MTGLFLDVLGGKAKSPPPIWMMRQAGRYLPEYRATRAEAGSFLGLCKTPRLSAEVTLQPIRRFDFDAAIIFSDILTVPMALGHPVTFDEGPKLPPLASVEGLERDLAKWRPVLAPVYEALALARAGLVAEKALLGFAGAPWTLAVYLAGGGNDEQRAARLWAYRDPDGFDRLIALLVDCVSQHLLWQLEAGADAVQIFDSWAGGMPVALFERYVVQPTRAVVEKVRAEKPGAKIIGFPRGGELTALEQYVQSTNVDAVSLDTAVPLSWAVGALGKKAVLQGNLDPIALIAGGDALRRGVGDILTATQGVPFIFNLGHGILPTTPIEHVHELVKLVRGGA